MERGGPDHVKAVPKTDAPAACGNYPNGFPLTNETYGEVLTVLSSLRTPMTGPPDRKTAQKSGGIRSNWKRSSVSACRH